MNTIKIEYSVVSWFQAEVSLEDVKDWYAGLFNKELSDDPKVVAQWAAEYVNREVQPVAIEAENPTNASINNN